MKTAYIAQEPGKRKPRILPPYLTGHPLIAITGDDAYTAVERLKVQAAGYGLRCLTFDHNAFVLGSQYATIMKEIAAKFNRPLLYAGQDAEILALADFTIHAPAYVGNRCWLIWPDGNAHSICLPEFTPDECRLVTADLLAGEIALTHTHLKRPHVEYMH